MDESPSVKFLGLLRALLRHGVEYANREKDRAVLPVLRQTLALKNRSGQGEGD